VVEAEAQLAEIKKAAMAVINKFNKRDAENEEEEDTQSSNKESYLRPPYPLGRGGHDSFTGRILRCIGAWKKDYETRDI